MGEDQAPTGHGQARRVTVAQAAEALGTTTDAVRSRIKRGTLESVKEGAHVYVLLDTDQATDQATDQSRPDTDQTADQPPSEPTALISEMRGRIEDLRSQLESERQAHAEARRIIAGLVERIPPAIEPPRRESPETRGSPETASEGSEPRSAGGGPQTARERPSGATEEGAEGEERRGFWSRLFGR